jgi:hypothetical protein
MYTAEKKPLMRKVHLSLIEASKKANFIYPADLIFKVDPAQRPRAFHNPRKKEDTTWTE